MDRLSLSTLPRVDASLRPRVDPGSVSVGIVHLGLGAFARAHALPCTENAMARSGDLQWGVCGVSQRSRDVLDQLEPQDGLYSLLVRSADRTGLTIVSSVRELAFALEDHDRLTARLAAPSTRLVTLTVTEKGYRHDPATGRLRPDDTEVLADAQGRAPRTVVGQLVRGLAGRRAHDAGPVTLLSCDNLTGNGTVLRALVEDYCALLPDGEALASWVRDNVAFPTSMVDRITPATTAADRAEVATALGLSDEGVVVTEPFTQWVIEDSFAAGRPPWQLAGALMTDDVAPYEQLKLRLLNGSHSTLAYLGALAGHEYVAEAMRDPALAGAVTRLMADDVAPTLEIPDGFDVVAYQRQLRERFENPALQHRTTQIAMDGSHKLPVRLLGTVRDRFAAGSVPVVAGLGVAAWMRYVSAGRSDAGTPLPLDDPLAEVLREKVAGAGSADAIVDALLTVRQVFAEDLADNAQFRGLVTGHLDVLIRHGAHAAALAVAA
jgi:fructuronate reductase